MRVRVYVLASPQENCVLMVVAEEEGNTLSSPHPQKETTHKNAHSCEKRIRKSSIKQI